MTIARYLSQMALKHPDRCAIIYDTERWTYSEYERVVNRLANAFSSIGVQKGDRIAVFNTNCPEHLFTLFAAAKLGAIYSALNCRLKGTELVHVLTDCEPAVVLVGKRYAEQVMAVTSGISATKCTLIVDALPGEPYALHDLMASADDSPLQIDVPEDATAFLLYTSGTTGLPKGVMHSHGNIIRRCEGRKTAFDDDSLEKVGLLAVPVFHVTGMQVLVKTAASAGTLVIMPQFQIEKFLQTIQDEGVMLAMVVPTMLSRIMEYPHLDRYNLDSLRIIAYGGSAIAPGLIRKAMRTLPCMYTQGYGLTEVGVTWLEPAEHSLEPPEGRRDPLESVGRVVPGIELAIVDENGNRLPPGSAGEIIVRGGDLMQGYWRRNDETAHAIRDGWFHTGDSGYLDEHGFLFMAGRKKDIIIRGGENIAPIEVENVLTSHPAVADAGVFGIPHPEWGEIVAAAVVLKPSQQARAEELIEYCRERMASFKKPDRVFFAESLPRNAAGKLVTKDLRRQYADS